MSLPVPATPGLAVTAITRDDLAALTDLCIRCSAFFELVEGRPGSRDVAEEILALLPPGGSARQKHLMGFVRRGDELVAVVDLGEDYPVVHDWYAALFLVSPERRGTGLGAAIWNDVERWIREQGGEQLRLAVQQQNPRARRFWERMGFTMTGETTQRADGRGSRVWQMEKSLLASNRGER